MTSINIYIEVIQTNGNYALSLTDSEGDSGINTMTTPAQPGDTITWSISTQLSNTTVAINSITEKSTSAYNVFSSGPSDNGDGTWGGTVSSNITSKETESYNIIYDVTTNNNTVTITDDPDIEIDPAGVG